MKTRFRNPAGSLEQHLVRHLGEPFAVTDERVSGGRIEVSGFRDVPGDGIVTLVTVGLSDIARRRGFGGIHGQAQELSMVLDGTYFTEDFLTFFVSVATKYCRDHRQLAWGEFLDLGMVIPGSLDLGVLFVWPVALFDDSFQFVATPAGETSVALLFPMRRDEVASVAAMELEAFGDALDALQPEIWDLRRPSLKFA